MNILVTGGAGFIGSHLTDAYLNAGHKVTVLDNLSTGFEKNINPKAEFVLMDITSKDIERFLKSEKFDVISHHAAQMNVRVSVDNPIFDATTNILGSINIFQAAKESGVKKVIFASSGGTIYGEQDYFPADELHPTRPCSPYGISKLSVEKYLFYYKEVCGLDFVSFRYGNVYGRRQNPHGEAGVVAIFLNKMLSGEQPVINGDGLITRDYIYIDDLVEANLAALNDDVSGIYNITTGIETNVNTIFNMLKELTGASCEEYHGPAKAGEQRRSVCSYHNMQDKHNWTPKTSFAEGLKKTVEFAIADKKM